MNKLLLYNSFKLNKVVRFKMADGSRYACCLLRIWPLLLCAGMLVAGGGCAATGKTDSAGAGPEALPERFSMPVSAEPVPQQQEGTIYGSKTPLSLYSDSRARSVGDILLVKIVETSSGSKKAETTTERESTVTGGISSLFGVEKWVADRNPNFTPSATSLNATLTNDFEGTGETKRNSTVTATMSARVVDVNMNGNLVIQGYRDIRVNNETQFMVLSGLVRPVDISPDNSILSSHIADARIEYSGTGIIGDKQQPGWLARALDVIWPF